MLTWIMDSLELISLMTSADGVLSSFRLATAAALPLKILFSISSTFISASRQNYTITTGITTSSPCEPQMEGGHWERVELFKLHL